MLYIWDIEKIIQETLEEHNLKIHYEFNNHLTVPMSYNVTANTIKFDYLQINAYIGKMEIKETDENFVKLILYRIIGYYLDYKKNKYDLRILLYGAEDEKEELKATAEVNAWEYGRTLVPDQLLNSYDKMRKLDQMLI